VCPTAAELALDAPASQVVFTDVSVMTFAVDRTVAMR
jgi:hypothetical protein